MDLNTALGLDHATGAEMVVALDAIAGCIYRVVSTHIRNFIMYDEQKEPIYPPFTGKEYCATHETIDDHPYAVAFGQFLGNGIHPDTANELAFGLHSAITQISDDPFDELRVRAVDIFDRLNEMNYWEFSSSEDGDREPNNFLYAD